MAKLIFFQKVRAGPKRPYIREEEPYILFGGKALYTLKP